MASFPEAAKFVVCTKNALFKHIILTFLVAFPLWQVYQLNPLPLEIKNIIHFFSNILLFDNIWSIILVITTIFMIGYFTESAHNYMRENAILFPNYLNPVKTFLIGVIVLITCLPMIFLMFFIGNCLYQIFISKGFGNSVIITSISFTELVLVGILCSQSNLFALTYNPLKAWNIIKIAKSFPDYSLSTFLFLIVGGLFVGFIAFPISYLIHLIFGSGVVYYSVLAFFTVLVLALYAQYNAQRVLEIPALFYRKMYTNNEEDRFK